MWEAVAILGPFFFVEDSDRYLASPENLSTPLLKILSIFSVKR